MKRDCRNIYKLARISAGLTQEKAAEILHVATRTLASYETGEVIPPADIVCSMCEIYEADWLAYCFLQSSNPVGRKYLPEIDFANLPITVLKFQKEMADASKVSGEMVEVTCDGQIDGEEQNVWGRVTREVKELVGAGLSLLFTQKEKTAMKAAS